MRNGPTLTATLIDQKFPHTETHRNMNVRKTLLGASLLVVTSFAPAYSEIMQQPDSGTTQSQPVSGTQTTTLPAQTPAVQGSAPMRVMVGKSLLINTTGGERLKRVSVTDPAIASALPITPSQILVHGRAPGEVSLVLWDEL